MRRLRTAVRWLQRLLVAILFLLGLIVAGPLQAGPSQIGGRTSPDGAEEIQIDLPDGEHLKNTGGIGPRGPGTGAGLCVFTSIEMGLGRWGNEEELLGFQQKMTHEQGGGWPEKVDQMMRKYAPGVNYSQYTGNDPQVLKLALKTGRMPGITYGYSPRYGGRIAHMVNCAHFTDKWAAVLDNNFPHTFEWMSPDELLRRAKLGNPGGYWIVFGLKGGPPPVPVNWKGNVAPRRPSYSYRGPALGAWGRGGCPGGMHAPATGPVGPNFFPAPTPILLSPAVVPSPEPLRWEWDGDQYNLMQGRVQVGALNDSGYRPRAGSGWGEPCEPSIAPPVSLPETPPPGGEARRKCRCGAPCCDCKSCRCRPDRKCCPHCGCGRRGAELGQGPAQNFGVNSAQLPEGETFSINGRAVSGDAIKRLSGKGGELADDSHKWHLTLIGSKEECDRVLADLEHSAALAPWKDRLLVQAYRPGSWAVKDVGFPTDGHPRIVVQGPPDAAGKGPVLWDQPDYQGGAEQLAQGLTRARRMADPNYDPSKDPGPDRRPPSPVPPRPSVPDPSLQAGHIMPCCVAAVLLTLTVALAIRRKP